MKKQRHFSSYQKILARMIVYPVFAILLGLAVIYTAGYLMGAPDLSMDHQTVYYNQDGKEITSETKKEKKWVALKDMSPYIIDATIAIEDRRFFEHKGFDFKRIFGAIYKDIRTKSLKEGASTLTQQYARSMYLSTEKTWQRKLKEAFLHNQAGNVLFQKKIFSRDILTPSITAMVHMVPTQRAKYISKNPYRS
ncbi:biosynthetic peptidoglycan transglycosylase [Virgibacillus halophilus]|uniref:peptidoglycan glycosyltransferase n=1 Tax=Tigheibacillus halophilus TaxID=361280 RepID=A0ABU5C4K8_9BACI|nr:biosynthetic peptidoglycan transglycosylase [Virgibacillus halophilus]